MTDITTYPMIDDFDTTLAQAWDGAVGTVYLNEAVGITLPASTTTYLVVNPGKSTMQVAKINAVNNTLKTATVSSITVDKGAGVAYTQQSHPVGSVVRISSNYAFWKDIVDSLNTKVNTNDDDIAQGKFADATARDAYFTSPVNGNSAYLTAEGKRTDYVAGAWADRDVGTVTANASTTVAGKVELATEAEGIAGTATGGTGASLDLTPDLIAKIIQSGSRVYCASTTGSDTYTANLTPSLTAYTTGMLLPCKFTTTNTGACSININSLGAKNIKTLDGNDPQTGVIRATGTALLMYDGTNFVIQASDFATTSNKGDIEIATDAEVVTGTDTARAVTPAQVGFTVIPDTTTTTYTALLQSSDTTRNSASATYVKLKEIVATFAGTYTVYFELAEFAGLGGNNAYGRIYKNGVAFGTEQNDADTTFTAKVENLTFAAGDLIQLYVKAAAGDTTQVRNFRLYGYVKPLLLTLTVNTD